MLKVSNIFWGKPVFGVFMFSGKSHALYCVVVLCLFVFWGVCRSLYKQVTRLLTSFFHGFMSDFISVNSLFIPAFHTTNNKRLLSFNIVINCRRLV